MIYITYVTCNSKRYLSPPANVFDSHTLINKSMINIEKDMNLCNSGLGSCLSQS